jgi:hypothetical protein
MNTNNDHDGLSPLGRMKYARSLGKRYPVQIRLSADVAKRLQAERDKLQREIGGVPSVAMTVEHILRAVFGLPAMK